MRVTKEYLKGDQGQALQRQIGHIKRTAVEQKPIFTTTGPVVLQVRKRSNNPRVATTTGPHAFMGTEKLTLSDVFLVDVPHTQEREVRMLFQPVDLALNKEMQSLTLPMGEAIENIEGIENWIETMPEPLAPPPKPKSEVEMLQENPDYGAW